MTLQRKSEIPNTYGEIARTWNTLSTVWGSVAPISAKERGSGSGVIAEASHRVRIRYLSTLTEGCRVSFDGGRLLDIVAVLDPNERHAEMELLCTECLV